MESSEANKIALDSVFFPGSLPLEIRTTAEDNLFFSTNCLRKEAIHGTVCGKNGLGTRLCVVHRARKLAPGR